MGACNAAWSRPDLFDAAGCGSPSMWYPTTQCVDGSTAGYLNGTYFAETAMVKYRVPTTTRLYISDGTTEGKCMGGTSNMPGPIALLARKMQQMGLRFSFEENIGFQHDEMTGWYASTL